MHGRRDWRGLYISAKGADTAGEKRREAESCVDLISGPCLWLRLAVGAKEESTPASLSNRRSRLPTPE